MCIPIHEEIVEQRFDSFCKTVLRNHVRNIYAVNKRRNEMFVSLDLLSPRLLGQLGTFDKYSTEQTIFRTQDYEISIDDVLLAQSIESLSKKQQDIILLSFFLGMKSIDIAILMKVKASTIHYHKEQALKNLRNYMEEHSYEA